MNAAGKKNWQPKGYRFDGVNHEIRLLPEDNAPGPQSLPNLVAIDGALFVFATGHKTEPTTLHKLAKGKTTWETLSVPQALQGRYTDVSVVLGDEWIVAAGDNGNAADLNLDGFAYSPNQDSWSPIPDAPHAYLLGTAVALDSHRLFVWGGGERLPGQLKTRPSESRQSTITRLAPGASTAIKVLPQELSSPSCNTFLRPTK